MVWKRHLYWKSLFRSWVVWVSSSRQLVSHYQDSPISWDKVPPSLFPWQREALLLPWGPLLLRVQVLHYVGVFWCSQPQFIMKSFKVIRNFKNGIVHTFITYPTYYCVCIHFDCSVMFSHQEIFSNKYPERCYVSPVVSIMFYAAVIFLFVTIANLASQVEL